MTPQIQNLLDILVAGRSLWTLCAGGLACILIDSLWPKKLAGLVYGTAIVSLMAAFALAFDQWMYPEMTAGNGLFIMDRFTLYLTVTVIFIAIMTLLNAFGYLKIHHTLTGEFSSLILFSVVGMILLYASDHLILNFIGLETMSLAVYVLVGSSRFDIRANEAAVKYFILGGVASAVLLYGIALFYGAFGTFKLSELALKVATPELDYLPKLGLALILCGLFFKIAVAPFHFWAPDVYEGAPAPVTGFMATGVKTAAFGFAIRLFLQFNVLDIQRFPELLLVLVVATLVIGNLGAIAQDDVKRLLAYSSIAHAGFLLLGILAGFRDGIYTADSADTVIFYLFSYLFMTLGAFGVLSLMAHAKGEATGLGDIRGLGKNHPVLAGAFSLFLLAMLGLPGTGGFTAKYGVVALAVANGHVALAVFAVAVSAVAAVYYLKPIAMMFFVETSAADPVADVPLTISFTITFCAVAVLFLGLMPDTYLKLAEVAVSVWQ